MKFIFFIWGFLLFLQPNLIGAEVSIPSLSHTKKLEKILELDSILMTKIRRIQRNNLFEGVVKDMEILRSTWNLRPTVDVTLRYTPYLQKYSLSCEIAALAMVLHSLGSPKTEDEIISLVPYFPQVYTGGIWGDPDKEFVGYYTGSQRKWTGYGVYPYPLSKVVNQDYFTEIYSLLEITSKNKILAKMKMSEYLQQLKSGTHVILWGDWCTQKAYEDGILSGSKSKIIKFFPVSAKNECERDLSERMMNWVTPNGDEVFGLSGEHAFVLLGYIGKSDNPSHIIVWDTDTGRHTYHIDEWMRKWGMMNYRALTIRDFE